MFKEKDFVHLHLHTDYSLLQSTIQVKPLAKKLQEFEMSACAITDAGNLYGAITFYTTLRAHGIKPIIGYEAFVTLSGRFERNAVLCPGEKPFYKLVLLAQDLKGYQNLVYLASKAFTEGFFHKPRIDLEILAERSEGLIALSGGAEGVLNHYLTTGRKEEALVQALHLREIFGAQNFYVEIQNHGLPEEERLCYELADLAAKISSPVVATNDAFYLHEKESRAHEILLCIGEGKTIQDKVRTRLQGSAYYLRPAEEMWQIFGKNWPESLKNSLEIAERCQLALPLGENLTLPKYPVPSDSGCQTSDEYFEKIVKDGFAYRQRSVWEPLRRKNKLKYTLDEYQARVDKEIATIKKMGFADYFLIVWEFIEYAKKRAIPVGPGRGSAAGSLVAYCLGITDIDPLQYDLLFERFLNPERVSMPDIDIDFCVRGRAEVINHVTEFYGRESVCQIITFGTMASRAAIKDVGRALDMPYGEVEKVAKLIPPPVRGRNVSISQALEQVPELRKMVESNSQVKDLVQTALALEGCARHTSVHAAGIVISPRPLHEIVPVAISVKNELTSQFTMNDLEKAGMLKMDFLALTTLTIISDCLKSLEAKKGVTIDWAEVPLDDEKTMALFAEGRTEAIFQFESSGMQEICRRLKPKDLEDLAALNALYRPGPLDGGMVDDFIARHRGEKRVQYIVPEMKEILQNTYGILVYQEQIMQLAQKLAGYTLGEADMMRRAMGKKKREEMAQHERRFVEGAVARGIKKEKAEEIFKLMAQFADYGFNRSHSVAYAYLAFQTAYLKAHYPAYFYASVLSHEAQDSARIYKYARELKSAGLALLPPDINESDEGFTPLENAVRFGLTAIKGIGASSVQAIIKSRREGPFVSVIDFAERLEPGAVNRKGMESLVAAGAFDSLRPSGISVCAWRARLYSGTDKILAHGQKVWNDQLRGQNALFGQQADNFQIDWREILPEVREWTMAELSGKEKLAVGFFLSAHPLDEYQSVLEELGGKTLAEQPERKSGEKISLAGVVTGLQIRHSKKGNRFCIFRLEDQTGGVKCLAWSETFMKYAGVFKEDEVIWLEGRVENVDGTEITVIVEQAMKLAEVVPRIARKVFVSLPSENPTDEYLERLLALLSREQGNCEVFLKMNLENRVFVQIHSQPLRVKGTQDLQRQLRTEGVEVTWVL